MQLVPLARGGVGDDSQRWAQVLTTRILEMLHDIPVLLELLIIFGLIFLISNKGFSLMSQTD